MLADNGNIIAMTGIQAGHAPSSIPMIEPTKPVCDPNEEGHVDATFLLYANIPIYVPDTNARIVYRIF